MTENNFDKRPVYDAACHCGTVRFTVLLIDGLRTARRCNCSYCSMRGAVAVSAHLDDIKVLQGEAALRLYQFNTGEAKHYFCSCCGIYTFHQRRSSPHQGSEEHTSELQSRGHLVCRLLLEQTNH